MFWGQWGCRVTEPEKRKAEGWFTGWRGGGVVGAFKRDA